MECGGQGPVFKYHTFDNTGRYSESVGGRDFLEIGNSIEKFRTYAGISEGWISGGMANSEIMNQMQADIYGLPLKHMENSEATARGALIVALTSQGIWNSAESAFQTLRASDKVVSYEPDQKKTAWYISKKSEMNRIYQKIYQ